MEMTLEQFGARVRMKYPTYAKFSNKEIAVKVLAKYPQYAKQISDLPQPEEKGALRKVGDFLTSSTQKLGGTLGQVFASEDVVEGLSEAEQRTSGTTVQLRKQIRENKAQGKDTARLEKTLFDLTGEQSVGEQISEIVPGIEKSNKQVLGEIVGTGVEALSGGVVSGLRGFGLSRVAPTAASAASQKAAFLAKSLKGRVAEIGMRTLKNTAQLAPFGYALDVARNLEEDESGASIFKPGLGTAISAIIPLSIGGVQVTRQLASAGLERITPQLSGVPTKTYQRLKTGGLTETIGGRTKLKVTTPEKVLDEARASASAFKSTMQREFGKGRNEVINEFTGKRIMLDDKSIAKLKKIAERFGFDDKLPRNMKNMSAKATMDLLSEINSKKRTVVGLLDDPLVRGLKINLGEIKGDIMKTATKVFGGEEGNFAKLYDDYAVKSSKLKDIQSIIGKVGLKPDSIKLTPQQHQTLTRRLQKVFNDDAEGFYRAIQALEDETGDAILDKVAASQLAKIAPKSFSVKISSNAMEQKVLGFLADIVSSVTLPLSSPRISQWLIRKVGGYDPSIVTKLLNAAPSVRNAIYNAVHKENMAFSDAVELYAKDYLKNPKLGLSMEDVSGIPKDLQPLAQEARKYKSAEEFVRAQPGKVLYRATDSKSGYAELGNGIYGADKPAFAKLFGKNIELMVIDPKANIIKEGSPEYESLARATTPRNDYKMNPELARKTALARGIDGIEGIDPDTGTVIFNDAVIKTKSQLTDFYNKVVGKEIPAYKGEKDITTKVLSKLTGRTTVSKQFISDLTNSPDLKQPERDLIRQVLNDYKGDVPVKEFANKVKSELLPLKTKTTGERTKINLPARPERGRFYGGEKEGVLQNRYENIVLPDDLRGEINKYAERIYESPIKTSASDVHFADASDGYFAHSRFEDLAYNADLQNALKQNGGSALSPKEVPKTRRVIELQSDLFQKGRLESERIGGRGVLPEGLEPSPPKERLAELSKLEPYRNTWHERIIREEVKQAAKDGKTKLQFPTGETAMKIEGLGQGDNHWAYTDRSGKYVEDFYLNDAINKGDKSVIGMEARRVVGADNWSSLDGEDWIITDVLGDGKFKAIPKSQIGARELEELQLGVNFNDIKNSRYVEEFDISGKVDTNNPVYRFYEKEVGRYLTNKYGAKRITDAQGVSWYEVPITKEMKRLPIEAFGAGALLNEDE